MSGCAPPFVKNSLNRKTMMFKSMKSMNESRVSTESLPCLFEDQLAELLVMVRQDRPRHDQTVQNLKQLRTKQDHLNFHLSRATSLDTYLITAIVKTHHQIDK